MKERPIIYSADMIRALAENRKDVTRRLKGLGEINECPDEWKLLDVCKDTIPPSDGRTRYIFGHPTRGVRNLKCPFGEVGDVLWARETFWQDARDQMVYYEDDHTYKAHPDSNPALQRIFNGTLNERMLAPQTNPFWKKKPSIHMPRWASRFSQQIVRLSAEGLQEISEEDARREGFESHRVHIATGIGVDPKMGIFRTRSAFCQFRELWNALYPDVRFFRNPWVWRVEAKRLVPVAPLDKRELLA